MTEVTKKTGKVKNVVNVTLVDSTEAIQKNIDAIKKNGKKLQEVMHSTALSILIHVSKHGNINQARELVKALPLITSKGALEKWFVEFGCFKYNEETGLLDFERKETNAEAAQAKPFWSFIPPVTFVPITETQVLESIERLVKRIDETVKKGAASEKVVALQNYLKEVA